MMSHSSPTIAALPPPEEVGNERLEASSSASASLPSETATRTSVATLSSPWEFDELQRTCASCETEFNPLNRRHHCRLCGKIFCNECSNQRALIPPSSIVLVPKGGKKAKPRSAVDDAISASFSPDEDPDRMLTYLSSSGDGDGGTGGSNSNELLYGKGLEERFKLAREPLRVCRRCCGSLQPLQEDLRNSNSNAMRFNHIDPTDPVRLFNSPLAFTLGHEIRKAAYTLNNLLPMPKRMGAVVSQERYHQDPFAVDSYNSTSELQQCKENCSAVSPNLGDLDGVRIPARLLEEAKGVAVMTVCKGGFGLAGVEFGSGLVVARLDADRWSAPSAIGTGGMSWGALVGAQVSDHVFLLMTDAAVEMLFSNDGSVQLGADVGVALGPLGRSLEADFGAAAGSVAPIYTYSLSKGFYAGVSLAGKVIFTRHRVNEKFYGRQVGAREILQGDVPTPPAAQPLYEALTRCHVYATGSLPSNSRTRAASASASANNTRMENNAPNNVAAEYGETFYSNHALMPPAAGDQHSYAGMSDISTNSVN
jgi:lipid-binding SYLF domain-containing protein